LTHSIQIRGCQLLKSDQLLDTARGIGEEHLCPVVHLCPRSESKWSICVRLSHISGAATRGTARCVLVYLLVYSIALAVKVREINHIDAYFDSRSRSRMRDPCSHLTAHAFMPGGPKHVAASVPGDRKSTGQRPHLCPVSWRVAHWCPVPPQSLRSRGCNQAHRASVSGYRMRISACVVSLVTPPILMLVTLPGAARVSQILKRGQRRCSSS
jgi:hypothetical protein